jgi:hypothetical protein
METYQIHQSAYARGMCVIVVPPEDDLVSKGRAAALADAFTGGRYSYREHGYLAPSIVVGHFVKALALGCTAAKDGAIEWQSPDGGRFHRFSHKSARQAFRRIQHRD